MNTNHPTETNAIEGLLSALEALNQGHLARHYRALTQENPEQAAVFIAQVQNLDLPLLSRLYQELVISEHHGQERQISPLQPDQLSEEQAEGLKHKGLQAIGAGKVAVLLLAGGQGSRLGHEGPKGTFDIGLESGKSLFEIQADALKSVAQAAGYAPHWYVMTSATNNAETVAFFEEKAYFGYPVDRVHFFEQGMMPSVDFNNRVLLSAPGQLALNPDGNGGCFIAMKRHGILDKLRAEGVEWLFLYGVDNAIVNMADPVFVGYAIESGKPAASKVVAKAHAGEKVGVLCYDNGRPAIVEYSEMTEADNQLKDARGQLVYQNGNILNHLLSLEVLADYMDKPLTFHLATKKIPYWDAEAGYCQPGQPNGYKYESFIFDLFPHFSDMGALMVSRALEFAPVKNATGEDSPETARALYRQKHGLEAGGDMVGGQGHA